MTDAASRRESNAIEAEKDLQKKLREAEAVRFE
jgi:hypothetical protein